MFNEIAFEYFEKDLYTIPLNGKIPLVKNWSMFSSQKPSELLIDSWVNRYPHANIGFLTGKLTRVIAIDIDKDSALKMVPNSPLVKKGKKGETRFFKYNGETNFKRHDLGIELLSTGNQTVLPPSIHPETKEAYVWTSLETLLSYDVDDLPILPQEFFDVVGQMETLKGDTLGRHNSLIEICGAMVGRGEDATTIIEELQKFDIENHTPPYFTDKNEPHKGAGYHAALSMYMSVSKTAKQKGEFVEPKKVEIVFSESEIQKQIDESNQVIDIKFPEPRGFIKEIRDLIIQRSHKPRPKFALASALSLVGAITSNKVRCGDSTPNLFQLIIAESGEGKDVPLKAGKELLIETGMLHLLGLESYRGDKALVKKFESQRERLDIIDEISKLFRSMKSTNSFTSNIAETLTELWNSSSDLFTGFTTSEDTTGMVFNPALSLIGATTPNAFSETFSNSFLMQGFGGRFLYIMDETRVDLLEPVKRPMSEQLEYFLTSWGNREIETETIDISRTGTVKFDFSGTKPQSVSVNQLERPVVVDLPIEKDAQKRLKEIMHYFHELSYSCNEAIRPIAQRAFQQTKKIMIIDAVANQSQGTPTIAIDEKAIWPAPIITLQSVEFAFQYVEACLKNTDSFFKENLIQSRFHKDSQKVIRVMKRFPAGLSKTELTKKLVNQFKASELYDKRSGIISNLVEAGTVLAFETKKEGSQKSSIRFIYKQDKD